MSPFTVSLEVAMRFVVSAALVDVVGCLGPCVPRSTKPNVVLIMADDMGFGDVQTLNPNSRIPTPHLNDLAADGMTFVDAHSPSAVCTPTRYALVTGRYCLALSA